MHLEVYLAGQIHDDWRDQFRSLAEEAGVDAEFYGPQEDHDRSDAIGEIVLGAEAPNARWKDELASQFNNLRTGVAIERAEVVVALFGEKYRQWNTAMDCGLAIALDKPLIVVRDPSLHHALKEISQRAQITVDTLEQAAAALAYITE